MLIPDYRETSVDDIDETEIDTMIVTEWAMHWKV